MDSDSSSCGDRVQDLEGVDVRTRKKSAHSKSYDRQTMLTDNYLFASMTCPGNVSRPANSSVKTTEKSLSSQVMEYYHQYSQSSNLDKYLSRPLSTVESYEYRWRNREGSIPWDPCRMALEQAKMPLNDIPRERRKWARPPLIGQQSGTPGQGLPAPYSCGSTPEPQAKSTAIVDPVPLDKKQRRDSKRGLESTSDHLSVEPIDRDAKTASPATSEASHCKPLEWDSGADVGYHNAQSLKSPNGLCGIETMAFTRGICSTIQRTDPEGTTGSNVDSAGPNSHFKSPSRHSRHPTRPNANSTRLRNDLSESEDEIQITPIVKNNVPGIITGNIVGDVENSLQSQFSRMNIDQTPCSSHPKDKNLKTKERERVSSQSSDDCLENSLKKSASMHVLALPTPSVPLKRSQSELNLRGRNFEFVSTSSIATIVNKPITCDRNIQTNLIETVCERESIGIQVSPIIESSPGPEAHESDLEVLSHPSSEEIKAITESHDKEEEEEKPLLPKRVSSLVEKIPQSILKNPEKPNGSATMVKRPLGTPELPETSESQVETEGGRASNSFEYFPGDIYEGVSQAQGGSTSHVSSVDTGRSHSTMPNTSSSLDEKLWGDSDSLVRDLERSLNVLKSLVDAKKCDEQVKKRLIHHVIKRLVTAKYTDDKIEHNLEENVPWNPEDTRNKVYRTDLIQALAHKQKHEPSTEESSVDWKPRKKLGSFSKRDGTHDLKEMIDLATSDNTDIFEERNTDRTDAMQDGRKARMGLRNDDRHRHHQMTYRQHQKKLDKTDKSESSECFVPQMQRKPANDTGRVSEKSSITTNSSRDVSECQMDRRRPRNDKTDWRLPATISERRFKHGRCGSTLGTATRLIDYVEMEKKNQLVWINSEINHLSKLKKLLEDSKKHEREAQVLNGNSSVRSTLNDQWSSHGNLAERCEKPCSTSKKRNSCTQTAVNGHSGYSKSDATETASEIKRSTRNNSRELSNAYAQTSTPQSSRATSPWSPGRYCTQHGNKVNNCLCRRPRTPSPENRRDICSQSTMDSNKDAKNRLNDKCKTEFVYNEHQKEYCSTKRHCRGCKCAESSVNHNRGTKEYATGRKCSRRHENSERSEKSEKPESARSCRVCGTAYSNQNSKCQCTQTYMKPIAYEISFEEKGKKRSKSPQSKKAESKTTTLVSTDSCKTESCFCSSSQPQLKDYLAKNKPEFVDNLETRKRYMSEISQLRQLKKEKQMQLLAMASPSSLSVSKKVIRRPVIKPKKISDDEMKIRLRLRYLRLGEVRNKRRQQEKEEQSRKNHLMAKIFCKKLQQKALEGRVDLSQSVSVISNL